LPVDIISSDQLAKVHGRRENRQEENPKPVWKKSPSQTVEDAVARSREAAGRDGNGSAAEPKPEEKPVEKSPSAEASPRQSQGRAEADREEAGSAKVDPIAEALKKEEKKRREAAVQAATHRAAVEAEDERTFDQSKIAALLDKRDPTRQARDRRHAELNAALGLAKAKPGQLSDGGALFQSQVERCWKNLWRIEAQNPRQLSPSAEARRQLEGCRFRRTRHAVSSRLSGRALARDHRCSRIFARRLFDEWKYFAPVFTERRREDDCSRRCGHEQSS